MSVQSYLDASTEYVTEEDLDALGEGAYTGSRAIEHDYGWWIYVADDAESASQDGQAMSAHFWALVRYARERGCTWINLDRDGDECDGLAVAE